MKNVLKSRAAKSEIYNLTSASDRRVASTRETLDSPNSDLMSVAGQPLQAHKRCLRVLKFGGTSVADAHCIQKTIAIIFSAIQESAVVVVVSALCGVTNMLLEAGVRAETGDAYFVAAIFDELRRLHFNTAHLLLTSDESRTLITRKMEGILARGEELCRETIRRQELTLQTQDAISSVGERLSTLLVAAALAEYDLVGEAVDAVDLIVTDSYHGAAQPMMELTQKRSDARLRPLLKQGIIPVVTGFIGATTDGVLTTLGRGGSDYSATILAAALGADEVIIWTDVDGVLTSDPRLVSEATSIPELSYREAAELARFGAKVLHPKTMNPVMQLGIPLWIRNTFAPRNSGTKVSASPALSCGGVRAISALRDVACIKVCGPRFAAVSDVLVRAISALEAAHAELLMISHSSSQNDISFAVPLSVAETSVEALLSEFSKELADEVLGQITMNSNTSLIAIVGEKIHESPDVVGRTIRALSKEKVNILAVATGSSSCNFTFMISALNTKTALAAVHREFLLHSLNPRLDSHAVANRKTPTSNREHHEAKVVRPLKKPKRKSIAL
jgi:aspartate kinase